MTIEAAEAFGPRPRHATVGVKVGSGAGACHGRRQGADRRAVDDQHGHRRHRSDRPAGRRASRAGSEMVRITVDRDEAAAAVPAHPRPPARAGITVPIIGDFHYIGHKLLHRHPACAEALDKYRINPGNVGFKQNATSSSRRSSRRRSEYGKTVRIGVNWGWLDQELLNDPDGREREIADPHRGASGDARGDDALGAVVGRTRRGDRACARTIILSAKVSGVQDPDRRLSHGGGALDYAIHLGLTEAGMGSKGIVASSAALGVLLQEGIGDTIRVSLTPEPGGDRSREVKVAQEILQTMGFRVFPRRSRRARAADARPRRCSRNWPATSRTISMTRCRIGRPAIPASRR